MLDQQQRHIWNPQTIPCLLTLIYFLFSFTFYLTAEITIEILHILGIS